MDWRIAAMKPGELSEVGTLGGAMFVFWRRSRWRSLVGMSAAVGIPDMPPGQAAAGKRQPESLRDLEWDQNEDMMGHRPGSPFKLPTIAKLASLERTGTAKHTEHA
jgi:hypothetical protein